MTTELTPKFFLKKDAAQWATEYSNAIYSMSQSEEEVRFKHVDLTFFVAIILAGGCFVRDETLYKFKRMIIIVFGIHPCLVSILARQQI